MFNNNNKGYTKFVSALLVIFIFFILYKVTPFYYYYFEIKNQMFALCKLANAETDVEIKKKLYKQIKYLKIPASKDDIVIQRVDNEIRISLRYNEIFYITIGNKDYDLYTFDFLAQVQNEIIE